MYWDTESYFPWPKPAELSESFKPSMAFSFSVSYFDVVHYGSCSMDSVAFWSFHWFFTTLTATGNACVSCRAVKYRNWCDKIWCIALWCTALWLWDKLWHKLQVDRHRLIHIARQMWWQYYSAKVGVFFYCLYYAFHFIEYIIWYFKFFCNMLGSY